jgi:hypothetical protein
MNVAKLYIPQESAYAGVCGGQEVAIRISFANFCFFVLHAVVLMFIKQEEDPRVQLHGSFWLWKTLLWAGVIVGFFFVPSQALFGYAQVARIGSGIFLVLQLILLIHFLYQVSFHGCHAVIAGDMMSAILEGSVHLAGYTYQLLPHVPECIHLMLLPHERYDAVCLPDF